MERSRGFRGEAAAGLGGLLSALALGGVLLAAACSSTPRVPLRVVRWQVGEGPPEALFVLLPGRWDRPEDFVRHRFLSVLAEQGWRAKVWGCDLHVGYFREKSAAQRLGEDVLARIPPSLRACTFLVGISLGGLGAILADDAFPGPWKLVLLAPYLGGGKQGRRELAAQAPALGEGNPLAPLLANWLQTRAPQKRLWLGYGAQDPYALGHRFLAAELPPGQVAVIPGGHDWPTWRELFRTLLRRLPRHPCPP